MCVFTIPVESTLCTPISFQNLLADKTWSITFLSCWHFAPMQQMSCNFLFIQLYWYSKLCVHTNAAHTWYWPVFCHWKPGWERSLEPQGKTGSRSCAEAVSSARRLSPCTWQDCSRAENEGWVSRQLNICSVLGLNPDMTLIGSSPAREQLTFDFTDISANLWPSVKGICEWGLKSDLILTQF